MWDDYDPLVAVNTAYNEEVQIFTRFHMDSLMSDPDKVRLLINRFKVSIRNTAIHSQEVGIGEPNPYIAVDSNSLPKAEQVLHVMAVVNTLPTSGSQNSERVFPVRYSATRRGRLTVRYLTNYLADCY